MVFEYTSLAVGDPPNMRFVVFTPADEEQTAEKLSKLMRSEKVDSRKPMENRAGHRRMRAT